MCLWRRVRGDPPQSVGPRRPGGATPVRGGPVRTSGPQGDGPLAAPVEPLVADAPREEGPVLRPAVPLTSTARADRVRLQALGQAFGPGTGRDWSAPIQGTLCTRLTRTPTRTTAVPAVVVTVAVIERAGRTVDPTPTPSREDTPGEYWDESLPLYPGRGGSGDSTVLLDLVARQDARAVHPPVLSQVGAVHPAEGPPRLSVPHIPFRHLPTQRPTRPTEVPPDSTGGTSLGTPALPPCSTTAAPDRRSKTRTP